uniref:Uncharacterized protein n=1 Tax=Anguilla anguilla TaxID=7936 RepID=A0A0E9UG46_ANGAN
MVLVLGTNLTRPPIVYNRLFLVRFEGGAAAYPQHALGEEEGIPPWTGHQSIAGQII